MNTTHVTGIAELKKALDALEEKYAKRMQIAIVRCGFLLERYSKELVPVQTGHMKSTGGTRVEGTGFDTVAVVYYTADYALYVHENLEAAHGSAFNLKHADKIAKAPEDDEYYFLRGDKQQAQFLIKPFLEHRDEFVGMIKAEMMK